jgi:peroxiredoxin
MEQAQVNAEVSKELNKMLLKHFIEANNIPIVNWLKKEGFSDCDAPEMTDKEKMLMQRMESLAPGKPAPDVEAPDVEGKSVKLSSLRGKKAIAVLFWASWCHHCLEETPKIHQLYKEYKAKGLEVYAVSLDSKQQDWADAVKRLGFEWINVSDLKHWESIPARRFLVKSTPTIYILDQNLIIRKAVTRTEDIKAELDKMGL